MAVSSAGGLPPLAIPFNRPYVAPDALQYLTSVLQRRHLCGDGEATRQCQEILSSLHGGAPALLTTSCTHALDLSALLLDIAPGDEVLVPSYTFSSTANAFVLRGARPVFVDVRPDTVNIDEEQIESRISKRTRAIVLIHYAGIAAEMDRITRIAAERGIALVEDNAHGLFGTYRGRALGTFGVLSTLSFHETKNISCGEGGAIIVNDGSLHARAEIIREKGTNRTQFFRGMVDKYTWVDVGSSYLPSELLAAFLLSQLERRREIQERRRTLWERYRSDLSAWAAAAGVGLPVVPAECGPAYHLFYIVLPDLATRTHVMTGLREHGIHTVFHYVPLHSSPMGLRHGARAEDCPVSTAMGDRLLRLPLYQELTDADQSRIIERLTSIGL